MSTFRHILYVAPDPVRPDTAFEQALALCEAGEARLTVATAVERIEENALQGADLSAAELEDAVRRGRAEALEALVGQARERGVRAEARVLTGRPAVEIVREVVGGKHDLLIKEAGPSTERRRKRPGGLDLKLARTCPCPLWTARPGARARPDRILVAVDLDPSDHGKALLVESLLETAVSVALALEADLYILHAWVLYGEMELRGGFIPTKTGEVDRLLRAVRDRRRAWLDDLARSQRDRGLPVHTRLRKGRPEEVIARTVGRDRIDLVVMGTVARGGIPGLLIGNTAETVLASVDASVLTVKPPGFVTSVRLERGG